MSMSLKPAITAPTSTKGAGRVPDQSPNSAAARQQFMGAALSMSWQLAIVVLVPIIGGFELDQWLNLTPLLTILGFVLAMTGMGLVVWHQLQLYNPTVTPADIANAKKIRDAEGGDQ